MAGISNTYLLAGIRRQVEDKNGEEGDTHAGNDKVDGVEERLASHGDVEGDIQVRFVATGVVFFVPVRSRN